MNLFHIYSIVMVIVTTALKYSLIARSNALAVETENRKIKPIPNSWEREPKRLGVAICRCSLCHSINPMLCYV